MAVSKKLFGTDGVRGPYGLYPVTQEALVALGYAFGQQLSSSLSQPVLIAHDTRESSPACVQALSAGLAMANQSVSLLGVYPTPGLAWLVSHSDASAGIMISASHNPYQDNGVKFFDEQGRKLSDDFELALEAAWLEASQLSLDYSQASLESHSNLCAQYPNPEQYLDFLRSIAAPDSLQNVKLVIDCANGAYSQLAPEVLTALGAEFVAVASKPDGRNINEQVGSTYPKYIARQVIDHQADFGVTFDGDGDRVLIVDHTGELYNGDALLLLLVLAKLEQGHICKQVVGTTMTNFGLELALKKLNVELLRTDVGDRYVSEALIENELLLGAEASGHVIDSEYATTGDGLLVAIQVLSYVVQSKQLLSDLLSGYIELPQSIYNIPMDELVEGWATQLPIMTEEFNVQLGDKGRVVLRPSGTEPVLRVMVEASDMALVEKVGLQVCDRFRNK